MGSKNQEMKRKYRESVVNNLKDLFGNVLHIDIIRSVASHCDFDVQRSSNILLEMTNNVDDKAMKKKEKTKIKKSPQHTTPKKADSNSSPRSQPSPNIVVNKSKKSQELQRVVNNIRQGFKVLVILRGLPGSGKSRLAVTITDVALGPGNNSHHILSTDDFFVQGTSYVYDSQKLQEAHEWNQRRAFQAMSRGLSPVIIDNTNTQMWEMKAYAMMATDYGYLIEILEPDTWWCFNEKELARRNTHGVPRAKIKDMLERYDKFVTPQKLLCAYNLVYKFQKPPQLRLLPAIPQNFGGFNHHQNGFVSHQLKLEESIAKSKSTPALNRQISSEIDHAVENINLMDFTDGDWNVEYGRPEHLNQKCSDMVDPVDEILMCTEDSTVTVLQPNQISQGVQPEKSKLFPDIENAWGVNEEALQSWDIVTPITCDTDNQVFHSLNEVEEKKPEMKDNGSNVEMSDFVNEYSEIPKGFRVVYARGRDINVGSPVRTSLIPRKKMVDQSCTTEDLSERYEKNDEDRLKDLMDLFPRIPRSHLQELYDKCKGNFYWTVDLLLEDNHLEINDEKDENEPVSVDTSDDNEPDHHEAEMKKENVFKRKTISEDSLELKKCLEEKIDINKEHYSEHVLKVKQWRFGGCQEPEPSTSAVVNSELESESEDDSSDQNDDNPKDMIELNLGDTLVAQLETMFGGLDGAFPQGFQPVVQMPIALVRQIYSFYIESICQQMESQNHILDRLVKEDEEFAKKLQLLEETVPEQTPNLSEIMDEQVAINLHRKDMNEWKNMTADNLAARLTKQKLFNTFPNVDSDSLLEVWHANDYDYNKTVLDLIASVGPENVHGAKEAIKEPPLSAAAIEEMKDAEENCTELEECDGHQPATFYREQANTHLKRREQLYEKAKIYYQRGMPEVALFYSELAKKETKSYDKANHIAAVVFIDEHAKRLQKFDTLDLHFLYVKEAIPSLDMFIDRNVNLLKGSSKKNQDLFIITGRGKNSEGGRSKIKPAVISRLKKRNIGFVQLNPGLLKIRVSHNSLMTNDLS